MNKSTFRIALMDCQSEEQLIRMTLQPLGEVKTMLFYIPDRKLEVYHNGEPDMVLAALESLKLQTKLISTEITHEQQREKSDSGQRKILLAVLIINFVFFGLEMLFGILSNSMGLVADSLDMLADSLVYGLALFAVGGSALRKKNIARTAGYLQLLLALTGMMEVIRRFVGVTELPDFRTMMVISFLALIANAISLYILQKEKSKESHIQASMIFTSNDIVINIGVIVAALLVNLLQSAFPDLVIGAIVFAIVVRGAYRILRLAI